MSERGFSARQDEPLIGVVLGKEKDQVVFYFAHESEADFFLEAETTRQVQHLVGVWGDLDWEQMARELDSIRHDNPPSAPLDL